MSNEKYKFEIHEPVRIKSLPWLVCRKCGLVYLKNDFTFWCMKKGCNNEDHEDYNKERERSNIRNFK